MGHDDFYQLPPILLNRTLAGKYFIRYFKGQDRLSMREKNLGSDFSRPELDWASYLKSTWAIMLELGPWIIYVWWAYYAQSDVNTRLDGGTYSRCKIGCFRQINLFSFQWKHSWIYLEPMLPSTSWRSPIEPGLKLSFFEPVLICILA